MYLLANKPACFPSPYHTINPERKNKAGNRANTAVATIKSCIYTNKSRYYYDGGLPRSVSLDLLHLTVEYRNSSDANVEVETHQSTTTTTTTITTISPLLVAIKKLRTRFLAERLPYVV